MRQVEQYEKGDKVIILNSVILRRMSYVLYSGPKEMEHPFQTCASFIAL